MEALPHDIAHYVALAAEAIAILIIAIGSIEALLNIFRTRSREHGQIAAHRRIWRSDHAIVSAVRGRSALSEPIKNDA